MYDSLHVCYEGGAIDLGSSRLAADVLAADDTFPGPAVRAAIAGDLLREAERDGILANIWDHAAHIAIMASLPDDLTDFQRN